MPRFAAALALTTAALSGSSCGHTCGLALNERITTGGSVAPGESAFKDVALMGRGGTPEFDLSNTLSPAQPGIADAFLVPTSCARLFDGPYPGSTPLCQVHIGPTAPGGVSARVKLPEGTYRVWVQGYTANQGSTSYLVDVGIWDSRCTSSSK